MVLDLNGLDFTREEILDRIASKAADQIFGSDYDEETGIADRIEQRVRRNLDKSIAVVVDRIGDQLVAPRIEEYIRGCVLQQTNHWGEPNGAPTTFTEYLVKRAEKYVTEPVDVFGKTKSQGDYNWKEHSTRVVQLIDRYLQGSIELAVKQILADANKTFASGLSEAVKTSLKGLMDRVSVKTEIK